MRCFFIFLLLISIGCINNIKDIDASYPNNSINDHGSDIQINYYLKGNLEFQLIAPEIEIITSPEEKSIFEKGIKVFVYNQSLDTIATISADFAVQNKDQQLVEVRKNVILNNLNQEELVTEKLFWNKELKKIYTDDFVTLHTQNQIIMGFGFTSDQYFSTYSLSNITGTIYL
ncbi:MAG: LPS export ABC transporter periplasmic protein LptC [Flavobacteriales bacterium]|nr:LPS export ABC transporter periplasmic protein LptC [Flavobacteriales bacterium]|tara:strand:+ start:141 stop:659 length:519 start_codon:yes stop_codon:yes gene_type:complete